MVLNKSLYKGYREYPERIIQFGQGNFLRAFADWMVDKMNKEINFNSGVLIIQPRNKDTVYRLNKQDGLYTVVLNGIENGKVVEKQEIINCISRGLSTYKEYDAYLKTAENPNIRFMISNTTEAGISYDENDMLADWPPQSFPGKLTVWLYHRFKTFKGAKSSGLLLLPCELIDKNGDRLREIIIKLSKKWALEEEFINWVNESNIFYNTLVDRIVPGYPKENAKEIQEELEYKDDFLVQGELFHLWVIEGPREIKEEFPADKIGLNVLFVDDLTPYRERKVRILNGAHTSMVPVAYLYGIDTVREAIENDIIGKFVKATIFEEIIPTLDLPEKELKDFADSVIDRFRNPFIKHYLIDISLNSMSKFKTRVLPSLIEYSKRENRLPERLVFSLASLIYFYRGDRNGERIELSDDKNILELYRKLWSKYDKEEREIDTIVDKILGLKELWGLDLNTVEGLNIKVSYYLRQILNLGIREAIREVLK